MLSQTLYQISLERDLVQISLFTLWLTLAHLGLCFQLENPTFISYILLHS